jgi:hypothetical protein
MLLNPPIPWRRFFHLWDGAASREADNSLPSSAYTKNEWSCACIPHMCANSVYWDDFTFYVFYHKNLEISIYMIYLSTAIGLTPGGSGTVHIYT